MILVLLPALGLATGVLVLLNVLLGLTKAIEWLLWGRRE